MCSLGWVLGKIRTETHCQMHRIRWPSSSVFTVNYTKVARVRMSVQLLPRANLLPTPVQALGDLGCSVGFRKETVKSHAACTKFKNPNKPTKDQAPTCLTNFSGLLGFKGCLSCNKPGCSGYTAQCKTSFLHLKDLSTSQLNKPSLWMFVGSFGLDVDLRAPPPSTAAPKTLASSPVLWAYQDAYAVSARAEKRPG